MSLRNFFDLIESKKKFESSKGDFFIFQRLRLGKYSYKVIKNKVKLLGSLRTLIKIFQA